MCAGYSGTLIVRRADDKLNAHKNLLDYLAQATSEAVGRGGHQAQHLLTVAPRTMDKFRRRPEWTASTGVCSHLVVSKNSLLRNLRGCSRRSDPRRIARWQRHEPLQAQRLDPTTVCLEVAHTCQSAWTKHRRDRQAPTSDRYKPETRKSTWIALHWYYPVKRDPEGGKLLGFESFTTQSGHRMICSPADKDCWQTSTSESENRRGIWRRPSQ